ncbi:MAG TPA: NADH-ubiquinone oxidoreductase-F iron-sulfur binding region domain-containing protein [Kineosporiaceae bacterium]|nr:NADH-ubiquinone oxidoreductase-F iron-sulfur binding region domain-containing protein [Kineosporiaceae bacterium]
MAEPIDLLEVAQREKAERARYPMRVKVCNSTACQSAGAGAVIAAVNDAIAATDLGDEVPVVPTGCLGPCSMGPLVRVEPRAATPTLYRGVDADAGRRIVREHVRGGRPVDDLAVDAQGPFFARQQRIVLANAGRIDPDRLEDYIAEGGYRALEKALTSMTPAEVVEVVKASGLRGRGGAGYATGTKWSLLAAAPGPEKYVIANGDEGDPGAFMDRTVMEDDPHRVVEGLALAAYATGANQAYVYVRAEYPRAVQRLDRAIRIARRHRLLGKRILGFDFDLNVELRIGAGAFVCGEETSLMASIEGRRGTPRLRPPYPTQQGLFGRPTMINNVETLANIPALVLNGADWFRSVGTPNCPGTKVFALAGDLAVTGLIEVPMGITLREIVEDIGGGVGGGRRFKAAQTGGPSGGCIPAAHLDTPVDYESLRDLGSIMGSGGLIVMDETASMPQIARFFVQFCRDESCGKCVPCRTGTVQMHQLLDKICAGRATRDDLALLGRLCTVVRETSLCGLGQSAPNPVTSTMQYFREEYEALLVDGGPVGASSTGSLPEVSRA